MNNYQLLNMMKREEGNPSRTRGRGQAREAAKRENEDRDIGRQRGEEKTSAAAEIFGGFPPETVVLLATRLDWILSNIFIHNFLLK